MTSDLILSICIHASPATDLPKKPKQTLKPKEKEVGEGDVLGDEEDDGNGDSDGVCDLDCDSDGD